MSAPQFTALKINIGQFSWSNYFANIAFNSVGMLLAVSSSNRYNNALKRKVPVDFHLVKSYLLLTLATNSPSVPLSDYRRWKVRLHRRAIYIMPYCARCGTNVHPFSFRSFSKTTGRCNKCDSEIERAVKRFIDRFREFAVDGVLTKAEWKQLEGLAASENLDLDEALHYATPDIKKLVRKGIEIATQDTVITQHEEKYLNFLLQILTVPEYLINDVRATIEEYKSVQEIKNGKLPTVPSSMPMFGSEICHWETPADYVNTDTKTYPRRSGRLWLTNMKLIFISPERHFDLDWRRVQSVVREDDILVLEASIKKGNGLYIVERPMLVEAILSRLIVQAQTAEVPPRGEKKNEKRSTKGASGSTKQEKVRTPFEILDLPSSADAESIKLAYRRMAKLYHPDKVASLAPEFRELAELRMKEINAAYQQLMR